MNDIVLNYIIQAILGGASGYITNDYAINMLFKEYTPLKIGGVIKKTRGEFIENLSSMVENDIINKEKLQEILGDENFKVKFENLAADFYNNRLNAAVGDDLWDKIISEDTDEFVRSLIIEHSTEIYNLLIKNLNIKEFLSDSQLASISGFLYNAVFDMLKNNESITENILVSIYNDNLNFALDSIMEKKISQNIALNIAEAVKAKIVNCDNSEFKKLIDLTGAEKAFNDSISVLFDKKVKEVINLNDDVIDKIKDALLSYINSDKGYGFIYNLCTSLFAYGKKGNKSIFELLDSRFEENLKTYLVESIPGLTEKTVKWIKENNHIIDKLIEDSIDEVINESDGLKAKLLSTIKNTYLSGLSKKYSIIDKIIGFIENIAEPEKLSVNISAKIIDILNNITIGEIIEEAENNGLTPEKCTKIIIDYINKDIAGILNQSVQYIKEIKINALLPVLSLNDESINKVIIKFKELYSSNLTQDFLIKKLSSLMDNILSKDLESFITENKIKEISLNLNHFIVQKFNDNKNVIEKWICNQFYNATENLNLTLSNEAITFLNEELYNKYEDYSKKLRNIELSSAIDKLNEVENLANSSSDYLRSYAIKNTDTILKGSIKLIVTDNLNKLNDDELVDLANDFIGRELKPIMFFGGVLGVIAGIILAAFQNKPLSFHEINIANMIMYAFVGFITNVIAINMIFKPYKENKFLSKIPFFKNFSLGYIVKNQKIFAENTSYFIDNSLLNKKSISDLFEKHEDKIKNSFIKTAADNDYKILKNLLANNKLSIVNNVFLSLKGKLKTNLNQLCLFLYNKIKKIKISFLYDISEKPFKNYLLKFINAKNISSSIYNGLNSKHFMKFNFIQKYLAKFMDLFTKSNIKNYIIKYENKYQQFGDKQINEVLNKNQINKSKEFIINKTSSFLLSQNNRDKVFQTAYSLFNKSFDKSKTFEEIFDGKLKNYIDSQLPNFTDRISKMLKSSIQNNKAKITLMVQTEIKNQLGFIEKGMYNLMGGDEIIDELIKKIVNVKIPTFLELKKNEINNIISLSLNEKFYKTKTEILYTGLNKLQLKELTDNYINENAEKIENKIKTTANNLVGNLENLKINNILNLFYLDSIQTLYDVYETELNTFATELIINTKENKNDILALLAEFNKISYSDIFKDIKYEDCEILINNLINQLNKNNSIEKVVDELMANFVTYHGDTNIESIINENEINVSLKNYIHNLIEGNEFEKTTKEIFIKIIDDAVSHNLNFISSDAKDYLFNIFIDSTIESLKQNLDEILKSVEFDKIAKEEIEKMEPKKIHEMFNSFGGKYFRRLMIYGFGGFVFGINVYIGITLTALKIISQLNNNEN